MAKDYKIVDNVLIIDEGRTEISSYEFLGKIPKVTKVIIPEGVTKIEVDAFCGCKQLEEVVLPASLESIARNAFAHCPLKKREKKKSKKTASNPVQLFLLMLSSTRLSRVKLRISI